MRKILCALLCLCLFVSCENRSHSHNETTTSSTNKTEFNAVKSLAFIGGSIVYNPENPSLSHLYEEADIAFFLSSLDSATVTGAEVNEHGVFNDQATISTVSLNDSNDVYGYIHVNSVSANALNLTINRYSKDGSTKTTSTCFLESGQTLDINGDGKDDLRYAPLRPIRDGFKGAMCLEFISSEEGLYASMFATMPEGTLSKTSKTLAGYANSTFYGVNAHGDFIYIVSDEEIDPASKTIKSTSDAANVAHGDYVIVEETGEIKAVVGTPGTEYGTYELKTSEDYANSSSEDSQYESLIEGLFLYDYDINQFASLEGPRELVKKLPKKLLIEAAYYDNIFNSEYPDELPEDFFEKDYEFYIDILNDVVNYIDFPTPIFMIAEAEGITLTDEDIEHIYGIVRDTVANTYGDDVATEYMELFMAGDIEGADEYLDENASFNEDMEFDIFLILEIQESASVRSFIENVYPESPKAVVQVPEISTVYPLLSLNIGEIPTDLDQTKGLTKEAASAKAAASTFDDYETQKAKIDKEFDEFYSISLSSITISDYEGTESGTGKPKVEEKKKDDKDDEDDDDSITIDTESLHFDLALGITGSFNSRWGHLDCGLASAVYVSANANFREISQDGIELWDKDLAEASTTFFIGPVPITMTLEVGAGLSLDGRISTPVNFFAGFTGMYGGGVDFNADYGVKIKRKYCIPYPTGYFDTDIDAYGINYTTYYAGLVEQDQQLSDFELIELVLHPSIGVTPRVAIGPKYAYAGIEAPVDLSANLGFGLYKDSYLEETVIVDEEEKTNAELLRESFWLQGFSVGNYKFYDKLTIGTSVNVCPVIGVKIPVINTKAEMKWDAATLFEAEFGFTERGFEVVGEFFGKDF